MPRRRPYKTVSVDLVEHADAAVHHFERLGYRVNIEEAKPGFPYTPTLLCKRQRTAIVVEFSSGVPLERILAWVMYARSSGQDFRVAICIPESAKLSTEHENILRDQKVGLYISNSAGLTERLLPNDLGLNVYLPPLTSLPKKIRALLGSAYEQFDRAQWREGFEDACKALESEARRYIMAGTRSGRISLVTKKGIKILTDKEIDKMTMGQLANTFSQIQNQNHADVMVGNALATINPDRVGVVHHKSKARIEKRLRSNVSQNMWTIVEAMKQML